MSEAKLHAGGCHCKTVRYEVTIDLEKPVLSCNCSMCSKKGALLSFVPATAFKLQAGEDNLTDYQFNKNVVHHLFCKTCGVTSFARGVGPDGTEMRAINTRCLDDVDLDGLTIQKIDGKSR